MKEEPVFHRITNTETLNRLKLFDNYFERQLIGLRKLCNRALKDKNRMGDLYPLLISLLSSGESITLLIRYGLVPEAFIIARAFIERLVNLCYLIICEQSQLEDYSDYSHQKVYRSLESKKKAYENIGKIIQIPDFSNIPEIAKRLEKYTSHRGREITRWTTLRIEKRIEVIGQKVEKFKVSLLLAACNFIYEDASEAIHGTLYGALFHAGILFGVTDHKKGEEFLNNLRIILFLILGSLVEELLNVVNNEVEVDDLIEQSKENFKELWPYFNKISKEKSN